LLLIITRLTFIIPLSISKRLGCIPRLDDFLFAVSRLHDHTKLPIRLADPDNTEREGDYQK
jgi:hypothetical protein